MTERSFEEEQVPPHQSTLSPADATSVVEAELQEAMQRDLFSAAERDQAADPSMAAEAEATAAATGWAWNVGPAEFGPRGGVELLPSASAVDTRSFRAVSGGGGVLFSFFDLLTRDASALAESLLRI